MSRELFSKIRDTFLERFANFQRQGSNLGFRTVLSLDLHIIRYEQLGGSSYISLPEKLAANKAIIDLKNEGNKCFKWANAERINNKKQYHIKCFGEKRFPQEPLIFVKE